MSMINKEVSDFSVQAYVNGDFRIVTKKDILGSWSLFFFYPADFTFVCPTELEDLQNRRAARSTPFPVTATSCTRPGMTTRIESGR